MAEGVKHITTNRRARHEYYIEESLEAGMALKGSEVKSIRDGKINLQEAFCRIENGEMKLFNCNIAPYSHGRESTNHDPTRARKLLLHRAEIRKWKKATEQKGYAIVPLKVYFRQGYAKMEIGLAKGKKHYDKRSDIAEQESKRRMDRAIRGDRGI